MELEKARNVHHHLRLAAKAVHEHHKEMHKLHTEHHEKACKLHKEHADRVRAHIERAFKAAGDPEDGKLLPDNEPIDIESQNPAPVSPPRDGAKNEFDLGEVTRTVSAEVTKSVLTAMSEAFRGARGSTYAGDSQPVTKAAPAVVVNTSATAAQPEKVEAAKALGGDQNEMLKLARLIKSRPISPGEIHMPGAVPRG